MIFADLELKINSPKGNEILLLKRQPEKYNGQDQDKKDIPDVIRKHHGKGQADKSDQLCEPRQVIDVIISVNVVKQLRFHSLLVPLS